MILLAVWHHLILYNPAPQDDVDGANELCEHAETMSGHFATKLPASVVSQRHANEFHCATF